MWMLKYSYCLQTFDLVCHLCGRDAVALLLQNKEAMVEKNVGANTPWLIDLRRHDERALYGHIKGSMHIRGMNRALQEVLSW